MRSPAANTLLEAVGWRLQSTNPPHTTVRWRIGGYGWSQAPQIPSTQIQSLHERCQEEMWKTLGCGSSGSCLLPLAGSRDAGTREVHRELQRQSSKQRTSLQGRTGRTGEQKELSLVREVNVSTTSRPHGRPHGEPMAHAVPREKGTVGWHQEKGRSHSFVAM